MKRRPISASELAQITGLRQQGASWLRIERETEIPRRAAKRAFEDWERGKAADDLRLARTDVAREEFRKHLGQLATVAGRLTAGLQPPAWPTEKRSAAELWRQMWSREDVSGLASEERLVLRHHLMLVDGLRIHTEEKVRWSALDQWQEEWNASIGLLGQLRRRTGSLLISITNQDPKAKAKLQQGFERVTVDQLTHGMSMVLWDNILDGHPEAAKEQVETRPAGKGKTFVVFGDRAASATITMIDKSNAERMVKLCRWTLNNVNIEDQGRALIHGLLTAVTRMREIRQELEEMLDPLILVPLLLRTRCSLCPV